jgi:hypothetical protein
MLKLALMGLRPPRIKGAPCGFWLPHRAGKGAAVPPKFLQAGMLTLDFATPTFAMWQKCRRAALQL